MRFKVAKNNFKSQPLNIKKYKKVKSESKKSKIRKNMLWEGGKEVELHIGSQSIKNNIEQI